MVLPVEESFEFPVEESFKLSVEESFEMPRDTCHECLVRCPNATRVAFGQLQHGVRIANYFQSTFLDGTIPTYPSTKPSDLCDQLPLTSWQAYLP